MFSNADIQKIYNKYRVNQYYLDQNLQIARLRFLYLCVIYKVISERIKREM